VFVRFRKSGDWRLKVYVAQTTRHDGKVVQETIAYLGSIDTRALVAPDDARERESILARVAFWEVANPRLKALANRVGGEVGVKRLRMATHARIPWPKETERVHRLAVLKAEAEDWHRQYIHPRADCAE
jgi:hypothetical protein